MFFKMWQKDCKAHKINTKTMKEMKIYLFPQSKQNLKLNFQEIKDIKLIISKKSTISTIISRIINNH